MAMKLFALLALLCGHSIGFAVDRGKLIEYKEGSTTLEGYLSMPPKPAKSNPAVLIVHAWGGIGKHERATADKLAGMGYVAFCADIYGKGVRPTEVAERGKLAGSFKSDRALFRKRLIAGLNAMKAVRGVDKNRTAAIGYCFGGTGVLELARMNAPVRGVVSFHGGLDKGNLDTMDMIRPKVLVCHGADDPFVPPAQVEAFQKEFGVSGADFMFVSYPGAVHSFTDPEAGNDPKRGAAFDASASEKSWEEMSKFLKAVLK